MGSVWTRGDAPVKDFFELDFDLLGVCFGGRGGSYGGRFGGPGAFGGRFFGCGLEQVFELCVNG